MASARLTATRSAALPALLGALATLSACGATRSSPPVSGRAVFNRACAGCHSISGADDPRLQGGDLLDFHAGRVALVQFTREMPVRRPLTSTELQAVVGYVLATEERR